MRRLSVSSVADLSDRLREKLLNLRRLFCKFELKHPVAVSRLNFKIAAVLVRVRFNLRDRLRAHHQNLQEAGAKRSV